MRDSLLFIFFISLFVFGVFLLAATLMPEEPENPGSAPTPAPQSTPTSISTPTPISTPTTTPTLTSTPTLTPTSTPFDLQYGVKYKVKVVDVIDGDTIDVIMPDGSQERIRMLGVDTPETTASKNKAYEYDDITDLECLEYWGLEAKDFAKSKLEGKYVYIELDPIAGMRGYYGRLLAYVYYDSTDFTAELVKKGYARVYEEGECQKESEYLSYQHTAMEENLGLWSCKATSTTPTPTPTQTKNCDPSYPDVCIPPPPPDLDCKDIPYRNFRVLPPDPHHFDRDKDGIGCEQ